MKLLKEWTSDELGEFPSIALEAKVDWHVRTVIEADKSSHVAILEKPNYPRVQLKSDHPTIHELLDVAIEQIRKVFMVPSEVANDSRLTLDVLKRHVNELQYNTNELELINKCIAEGIQFLDSKLNIMPKISITMATELINIGLSSKHTALVERRKTLHTILNIKEDELCHSNTPLVESLSP